MGSTCQTTVLRLGVVTPVSETRTPVASAAGVFCFRKFTTIVVGPDGREFDLGTGQRFPKTKTYIAVNAFTREIA